MLVELRMTQDDIDRGQKASCYYCPVAMMVKRILYPLIPRATQVVIGTGYIWIGDARSKDLFQQDNIYAVAQFVSAFDNNRPYSPITITVDVPDSALV